MKAQLGEKLHDALREAYVVETTGWAVEQVTRVAESRLRSWF